MKLSELVATKCNEALNGSPSIINLAGMPDNAAARARVFVSKFNAEYLVTLSVSHDRAAQTLTIARKQDRTAKTKRPVVEIPICLFGFVNGQSVNANERDEVGRFRDLLVELLDGTGPSDIIAENENLI